MEALDTNLDHVRGAPTGRLIVEYGDDECPYSRMAYRQIQAASRAGWAAGSALHFGTFP